ncbi:MAG TPA: DUF1611 domain-containing protein [Ktedonobacterales bacterium]|jgi:uncharacterized NAD-dependent epimerase/dehydratase family protein
MRRIAILAEGHFHWQGAKTAVGMIRYGQDQVVAVLDSTKAGQDTAQVLGNGVGAGIPIVRDVGEALKYRPDTLLIGIAPIGGRLPDPWRGQVLQALNAGLHIISGLHEFLDDDPELHEAAERHHAHIWDVRRPPADRAMLIARYTPHRPGSHTVYVAGSDCNVGKMTTALELDREAQRRGLSSGFAATGQTGIMISGRGVPVDRLISDFTAGGVEALTLEFTQEYEWVFVEGQGSLIHPAYSPVTLGLLHGAMPDMMILCYEPGRTHIKSYSVPIPPLPRVIEIYEQAIGWLRAAPVVGIALNTYELDEASALDEMRRAEAETGLPATDCVRFGAGKLIDALLERAKNQAKTS